MSCRGSSCYFQEVQLDHRTRKDVSQSRQQNGLKKLAFAEEVRGLDWCPTQDPKTKGGYDVAPDIGARFARPVPKTL